MVDLPPEILGRFLSGEATTEDEQVVLSWARTHEEDRRRLFRAERLLDELRARSMSQQRVASAEERLFARLSSMSAQPSQDENLSQDDSEERRDLHGSHRFRVLRYAAVFAGILIVAAAAWLGVGEYKRLTAPEMLTAQATSGRISRVVLPDGTKVWLNRGATLRYPEDLATAEQRDVELDGEGYFEVNHNAAAPFTVKSARLTVTVLGTVFNMNTHGEPEVSLVEGRVKATAANEGGSIVLKPGQKASVDNRTGNLEVSEVDAYASALWHEGKHTFRDANIGEIARIIGRVYGMQVVVGKGIDQTRTYNGVVEEKGSIDSTLRLLSFTLPVRYEVKGRTVYLYPKR